jgi:hypothetical protein
MNTISVKHAAQLLGHPEKAVARHQYLATEGDAWTPQRYWRHEALTTAEREALRPTDSRAIRRIV